MADGQVLMIAVNLGDAAVPMSLERLADGRGGKILFETDGVPDAAAQGELPAHSFIAVLEPSA